MKIAFDEHIPPAMARIFQFLAKDDRRFRHLTGGLNLVMARDYAPSFGDVDYIGRSDEPWIRRFAKDGGTVIISGNTKMQREPHERLALIDEGMIVLFFGRQWTQWKFNSQTALLLHWWPVVVETIKQAKPATFWHIPSNWEIGGKLRRVTSDDQQRLKLERQLAAQPKVAAERRARRKQMQTLDQPELDFPKHGGRGAKAES